MVESWLQQCKERKIPISDDFNIIKIMGNAVEIRGWN